tara:strand:- start:806 stop:3856 length:3051 start_codon:yes stop_codon:yes gene_type:complete
MARPIDKLSIELQFKDAGSQAVIEKLRGSLKRLENSASGVRPNIKRLRDEILSQGRASVKSVSNINAQLTSLKALRDEAKIGGQAFKQLTADIKKLDAQMAKSGKTTQGRGGARQATQIAGAVISGGIFGGPEGALGAAGGAALGGVEGAFAGAAIGAQVGAFREALAYSAEYAAEIGKLQIALKGVTDVQGNAAASQANYSEALEAAAESTRDYNVPQGAAIRGITRLTAAVTGANGPVADAATTFKNVTAAIKATGGSTEDVQGAITAMVQVFSKGKVSAEELSGQLGERLPGAVTLFAKANKMTLPELQKNLKAGTVGLNELMNFIRQLGVEFDDTAKTIASSNEEAGARLTVAFDNMKLGVGDALKDTGAEFQNAFGRFIEDITPRAIKAAKDLAKALKPVIDNLDLVVATLVGLAAGAVIGAIVKGIAGIVTAVAGAKTAIAGLTAVMALNPIFAGALAVGGIVAGIVAITKAINGQANALERVKKAGAAQGATGNEKAEAIAVVKRQIDEQERIIERNPEGETSDARTERARTKRRQAAQRELARLQGQLADITRAPKKDKEGNIFKYKPVVDEDDDSGSGTKSKLARRIEQAQALESRMQRLNHLAQQDTQLGRILAQQDNQRAALKDKISKLTEGAYNAEVERATTSAQNLQNEQLAAELKEKVGKLAEKATKPLQDGLQAIKDQIAAEKRHEELIRKGISPERAKAIIKLEKEKKMALEILDALIDELKIRVAKGEAIQAEIDLLEELKKKRGETENTDPESITKPLDKAKTELEQFKESFEAALDDMINIGPKLAQTAASAIGTITDGLVEMIATGEANFKEMAASILKEIAKILLQAAIARTIKMLFPAADGAVVQGGRIMPYAKGGVVAAPTMFPMAGGDIGLMGEAGPEAIMPLKRGSNGRLGVEVAGRSNAVDAMNRYSRRNTAAAGGGMASEDEAIAAVQGSAVPIDVRYSVERINSVDYVTADQFQTGMQQAAQQGAKQGEQQTLKRLQMSGSTRKRIGI